MITTCHRIALGLLLATTLPQAGLAQAGSASPPAVPAASPLVAGHFQLETVSGEVVNSDDLVGTPYGLFFGFTHCPDVCPTTLADLTLALRRLPPAAEGLRIYFVSVDPADTAATLQQYTASFDRRIVPLGGDRGAVEAAIRSFGVVVEATALADGRTSFGHTASVFLVDADGLVVDRTNFSDGPDVMTRKLAMLARIPVQ